MRKMQKLKRWDAERVAFMKQFDSFMAPLYDLNTTDAIAEWLSENWLIYARHYGYRCALWGYDYIYDLPNPETDKVQINIYGIKFSDRINTFNQRPRFRLSNYDSDRGMTEFGWEGKIEIAHEGNSYKFFRSDQLRNIGIHTGSGGGGPKTSRYELKLFASDFPKMMALEVYKKMVRV
jgi:hypothetical protein